MKVSIISWRVFFESLSKQRPGTLNLWLCRWLFSNEGVMLADQFRTEELAPAKIIIKMFRRLHDNRKQFPTGARTLTRRN